MIVVYGGDGDTYEFDRVGRVATDEHGCLEVWAGPKADRLVHIFAPHAWQRVDLDDAS